jgi:hypothetical protein
VTETFKLFATDHERRLLGMGAFGAILVDVDRVNLDDLLASYSRPGAIVRCDGNPRDCVEVVQLGDGFALGCIAGWISEEA